MDLRIVPGCGGVREQQKLTVGLPAGSQVVAPGRLPAPHRAETRRRPRHASS